MKLRALLRGEAKYRAVLNAQGDKEYINAKVLPGQEFEFQGDFEKPPRWCIPVDDEARLMYEDAFGTSDPNEIPKSPTFKPGLNQMPHPSMRGKAIGQEHRRGAGTGIAGMDGDGGSPVMPY